MKSSSLCLVAVGLLAGAGVACSEPDPAYVAPSINPQRNGIMTFFVTSRPNMTGNLGGLAGADRICQDLAEAAGGVGRTWHAYLSAERGGPNGGPAHARDRIGAGPWKNYNGKVVANNVEELHTRVGDNNIFRDERATRINGQWAESPKPVEHDILTGSNADGTVAAGKTCSDWTSDAADQFAVVGHSDGLGPDMTTDGTKTSWNSAHDNGGCNDTAPKGGAGRFYCFAIN